jgi:hypothetical protein
MDLCEADAVFISIYRARQAHSGIYHGQIVCTVEDQGDSIQEFFCQRFRVVRLSRYVVCWCKLRLTTIS